MKSEIGSDLLRGVKQIACFINEDERATYHKLATGKIPAGKECAQWVASQSVLQAHYEKNTGARAA